MDQNPPPKPTAGWLGRCVSWPSTSPAAAAFHLQPSDKWLQGARYSSMLKNPNM